MFWLPRRLARKTEAEYFGDFRGEGNQRLGRKLVVAYAADVWLSCSIRAKRDDVVVTDFSRT
jgi:hypothetical protein